jgi:hypothetical protein
MPTIEIEVSERISRHLAAVRLMSHMVFPDRPELRRASEVTFRVKLVEWYCRAFAQQTAEAQRGILRALGSKLGEELTLALAYPSAWMKSKLFEEFLKPVGDGFDVALALADSPSAEVLTIEWTRRWFSIFATGRLVSLVGSIHEHSPDIEASLNKAIYVLCRTTGQCKEFREILKALGLPTIYESSLKEAWRVFKPVAHLCAAYVDTEAYYSQQHPTQDFMEYWLRPPALYDDEMFSAFCVVAKRVELFITSFRSHGQRQSLVSSAEIFSLPDRIFQPNLNSSTLSFRELDEQELAALKEYRAPKFFV